ncbi:single-stranded DNA-binding protein [Sinomonas halotolerans]|uniref:Single-stranded DNA-binding protein n=1 Tax=Sinomonas halotolerans TaxID=1644133 RepID=A0ABU9X1K7_9MICC
MSDEIALRGWVGTDPVFGTGSNGSMYARFRLAVGERWFDREAKAWGDRHTSWFTVVCFGSFAQNAAMSINKGSPVVVMGRLRTKSYQRANGAEGWTAEIVASSLGLDLAHGVSMWTKRRDEMPAGSSARLRTVEGVGAVDPVTGEVGPGGMDPFEDLPPLEDEDFEGRSPLDGHAGQADDRAEGRQDEGTAGRGPADRLLSA